MWLVPRYWITFIPYFSDNLADHAYTSRDHTFLCHEPMWWLMTDECHVKQCSYISRYTQPLKLDQFAFHRTWFWKIIFSQLWIHLQSVFFTTNDKKLIPLWDFKRKRNNTTPFTFYSPLKKTLCWAVFFRFIFDIFSIPPPSWQLRSKILQDTLPVKLEMQWAGVASQNFTRIAFSSYLLWGWRRCLQSLNIVCQKLHFSTIIFFKSY